MRDIVALVAIVVLIGFALRMATSLQWYHRSHTKARREVHARGQSIVAEIPTPDGLRYFTEDPEAFYFLEQHIPVDSTPRAIPKQEIRAARLLISGAQISVYISSRFSEQLSTSPAKVDGMHNSFERNHWYVAIDLQDGPVLVECGSIREGVSQEIAQNIFGALRREIEARDSVASDHHSRSVTPDR